MSRPLFSRSFILMMAITCGVCAGSNYYNQPLIYAMAKSLHVTVEQSAVTIVISQFAYALGLIVLIPLGDKYSKRKIIISLMVISGLAQICISFSQQLWSLYVFTFIATTFSIASQVLIPFISSIVESEKMSEIIGTLMSGLFLGILLARSYAGIVTTFADWHLVYLSSGILLILLAVVMYFKLPIPTAPNQNLKLIQIYKSMFSIAMHSPQLIRRGCVGAMAFASMILALSTMAFVLANPPYLFSELYIGLFGFVGAAGVFATKWAGKQIDQAKEKFVAVLGCALLIIQWLLLYFAQKSLLVYVIGLLCGYSAISVLHVLNQSLILRSANETRSRQHSIYMFMYFMGAAIGSMAGLYAWYHWGWTGCCIVGLGFSLMTVFFDRLDRKQMQMTAL
ncbi:MAG: MFS transporter [Acinetobacter sp.]|uniref:Predicted arabinose efflux permease, MFS family n=1 Tax=Acinetobacter albensis TaxID=1673609 RepID=A0A1C4GZC5_9GAMM|nr:MFS transporter [Acinetobacter albensis]SCC73221.1 Predicted arabinose efflux permease, MFS family [Acinetobacter albensis]